MIDEFTIRFKTQQEWGWLIVVAFFCGGVGAGSFLMSWLLSIKSGLVLGILLVAIGTNGALLLDLGRVDRFWRVFSHPSASWISRGAFLITLFVVFGALTVLPEVTWLSWLPWSMEEGLGKGIGSVASVLAFGVAIYSGFVLSFSPSIPFWNTTLLPILFVSYALAGGTAAVLAIVPNAVKAAGAIDVIETLVIALLVTSLVSLAVYLATMVNSTVAAKQAANLLVTGRLAPTFLIGVVVIGLLVPLALVTYDLYLSAGSQGQTPVLVVAAVLELLGGLLMRYCMIKAGTYGTVVLYDKNLPAL